MDKAFNYTEKIIKTRKQTVAFDTLQDPRHGRKKHTKECPKRDVCGECRCRVAAECGRAIAGVTRDVVDGAIDGTLFIQYIQNSYVLGAYSSGGESSTKV